MTQIGNHDDAYLSTPLEEKLAWFQGAPGLSAVEPARQFMAGAAALYADSDAQVRATMRGLGADWTGDAATNAGATLQRAADWSQDAGAGNSAAGETVEGYGQSFESLRGQVHWDDPWAWGWRDTATAAASVATLDPGVFLGNLTTDYFTTAQQNRTNDAAAVAALRAHEQQTRVAVDSFPALTIAGIEPSGADTGGTHGQSHQGVGLPFAPVTPAGASGGVSTDAGAGAGIAGPARSPDGGAPAPSGTGSALAGPVQTPGATIADGSGGPAGAGPRIAALPGGVGAGAGRTGAGGAEGHGAGGGGGSAVRPGLPGGGGGSAVRPALPGGAGALGERTSRAPGGGPLIGGGGGDRAAVPGEPASGLRVGDPAGRLSGAPAPPGGAAGGWRDVAPRGTAEPGVGARGPATGGEFAGRLPSASPETASSVGGRGATTGAGMPFLGGMGGVGARPTEHRHTYWLRSSEPFDVPLPPHGDGLLQGGDP